MNENCCLLTFSQPWTDKPIDPFC